MKVIFMLPALSLALLFPWLSLPLQTFASLDNTWGSKSGHRGWERRVSAKADLKRSVPTSLYPPSPNTEDQHWNSSPTCGRFNSSPSYQGIPGERHFLPPSVSRGLDLSRIRNVVVFGDSYSTLGQNNGSPVRPAVLTGDSALAGGRASNGPTWAEYLAKNISANIYGFAHGGAVVDSKIVGRRSPTGTGIGPNTNDFAHQWQSYRPLGLKLRSEETLHIIFFGINDASLTITAAGGIEGSFDRALRETMPKVADRVLDFMQEMVDVLGPTNFLVADVEASPYYTKKLFSNLSSFSESSYVSGFSVTYVLVAELLKSLRAQPGKYGFKDAESCLARGDYTLDHVCRDWNEHPFWISSHPSTQLHLILSEFVTSVVQDCKEEEE
ncbi:hypothetical protein IE53DRAFT_184214 [Violaceomyces palustris]|uniref:Uncharacterized protein n=1 Tax=Violaceomyces palustris TaxID=1673888 RepID=A0ACD0NSA3_9BASI|nr:hypothetical protein IE53DRAFT_184214 [Violaceomyces palustris]